jgi:hypothetical protein
LLAAAPEELDQLLAAMRLSDGGGIFRNHVGLLQAEPAVWRSRMRKTPCSRSVPWADTGPRAGMASRRAT